jgi:hypothetical protein
LETGLDFFSIFRVGFFFGLLSAGEDILNWKISTGMSFGAIEEVFSGDFIFLVFEAFFEAFGLPFGIYFLPFIVNERRIQFWLKPR